MKMMLIQRNHRGNQCDIHWISSYGHDISCPYIVVQCPFSAFDAAIDALQRRFIAAHRQSPQPHGQDQRTQSPAAAVGAAHSARPAAPARRAPSTPAETAARAPSVL